jgi:hypothetical protein
MRVPADGGLDLVSLQSPDGTEFQGLLGALEQIGRTTEAGTRVIRVAGLPAGTYTIALAPAADSEWRTTVGAVVRAGERTEIAPSL